MPAATLVDFDVIVTATWTWVGDVDGDLKGDVNDSLDVDGLRGLIVDDHDHDASTSTTVVHVARRRSQYVSKSPTTITSSRRKRTAASGRRSARPPRPRPLKLSRKPGTKFPLLRTAMKCPRWRPALQ